MTVQSKWVYVLIGNDQTGKTTLQKHLVKLLANVDKYKKLDCNDVFEIKHPEIIRKVKNISIGNRSIQEKLPDYKSIEEYFKNNFRKEDVCIISTHLSTSDAKLIINSCHQLFYNVCGVFFSNSIQKSAAANSEISVLNWDERWTIENPICVEPEVINQQLAQSAESFVQMLIKRTRAW